MAAHEYYNPGTLKPQPDPQRPSSASSHHSRHSASHVSQSDPRPSYQSVSPRPYEGSLHSEAAYRPQGSPQSQPAQSQYPQSSQHGSYNPPQQRPPEPANALPPRPQENRPALGRVGALLAGALSSKKLSQSKKAKKDKYDPDLAYGYDYAADKGASGYSGGRR